MPPHTARARAGARAHEAQHERARRAPPPAVMVCATLGVGARRVPGQWRTPTCGVRRWVSRYRSSSMRVSPRGVTVSRVRE